MRAEDGTFTYAAELSKLSLLDTYMYIYQAQKPIASITHSLTYFPRSAREFPNLNRSILDITIP